jgi:hypothetical protein
MKKKLLNIFKISLMVTILGFIMDGDPVEPSMFMRFAEFFAMIGIVFLLISIIYFTTTFIFKSFQRA